MLSESSRFKTVAGFPDLRICFISQLVMLNWEFENIKQFNQRFVEFNFSQRRYSEH